MHMNQQGCWFGAVTSLACSVQITDIVNPMFHGICVVIYPWPEGNRVGELSAIKQGSQHPESSRINNKLICELPDRLVCWAVFIFNRNKKKGDDMKKTYPGPARIAGHMQQQFHKNQRNIPTTV